MSRTWSREHSFCFPTAMRGISDQFKTWLCSFSQTANFKVSVDRICGTPLATPVTQRVFMTDGAETANFKVSVDRICGTPLATPVTQRVSMTDGAAHAVLVVT